MIDLGIREKRVDSLALSACERPRVPRLGRHVVADQVGDVIADGDDDAKASRGRGKGDEHSAGADQLAQATGNELEQARDISLLEHATCQIVEHLELPYPVCCSLVDLHLFDREAGLGREKRHDLLISFRELPTLFLGQVEIPVYDPAHEDRDTEEAPHLRMRRRKTEEVLLGCHVRHAYRASLSKKDTENAVIAG